MCQHSKRKGRDLTQSFDKSLESWVKKRSFSTLEHIRVPNLIGQDVGGVIVHRYFGISQWTLEIVIETILCSIRGSFPTIWFRISPLTNVKFCCLTIYNNNPASIRLYTKPWSYYRTRPFIEVWEVFIEHLRWSWHADRWRLSLRTPDPVPFWTYICSTCWDQSFSRIFSLFFRNVHFENYGTPVEISFYWAFPNYPNKRLSNHIIKIKVLLCEY